MKYVCPLCTNEEGTLRSDGDFSFGCDCHAHDPEGWLNRLGCNGPGLILCGEFFRIRGEQGTVQMPTDWFGYVLIADESINIELGNGDVLKYENGKWQ